MVEEVRKEVVIGVDTAIVEALDQGRKAADIFRAMRRVQKDHAKRITALEQAGG